MVCNKSCLVSGIFVLSMIYFYNMTDYNETIKKYKENLPNDLQVMYKKISRERLNISYFGFGLGLLISLCFIFYNRSFKVKRFGNTSVICIVLIISFITNYFYYILSPKSNWMLNHITDSVQIKNWLQMYKSMQYYYHIGFVFGIISMGFLAFAFRC